MNSQSDGSVFYIIGGIYDAGICRFSDIECRRHIGGQHNKLSDLQGKAK